MIELRLGVEIANRGNVFRITGADEASRSLTLLLESEVHAFKAAEDAVRVAAALAALPWDCILSAENVRHYKPDAEIYRLIPDLFDVKPDQVMLVAAHEHDLQAAQKHGLRAAYVHRPLEHGAGKSVTPTASGHYDVRATDFLDLAAQLAV